MNSQTTYVHTPPSNSKMAEPTTTCTVSPLRKSHAIE